MFDYKLVEIDKSVDFTKLEGLLKEDNNNYCLVFFHYDKSKILEDHSFVKKFEEIYKYNLNWINISDLFDEYKKLQTKLNLVPSFSDTINQDKLILNYIKEYIMDQFMRTGKYYTVKI